MLESHLLYYTYVAEVAELVDAHDSKSCSFGNEGSIPSFGTMAKQVLVIVGATTSGKTALSLSCAKKYNGEIISADSRQVYRQLNETTCKVTNEEMMDIPHYMIDIANPGERFTVYDFREQALSHINDILSRRKLPIIAGGTGFYIDSLLYTNTIANVPINPEYRELLAKKDIHQLQEELKKHSPDLYERIDSHNPRRLIRSLEIIKELGELPKLNKQPRFQHTIIGIKVSRQVLRKRIENRLEKRFPTMVKEIEELLNNGVSGKWFNEMGLECRHISRMILNRKSEKETKDNLIRAIFAYAKRQETWWKRYKEIQWFRENEFKDLHKYLRSTFTND